MKNVAIDNVEQIVKFKGKRISVKELGYKCGANTDEECIITVNILIDKKLAFVEVEETEEEKLIENLINEDEIIRRANEIKFEEKESIQGKRQAQLEEVDSLKISLAFDTTLEAKEWEGKIEEMGIENVYVKNKKNSISLIVEDITPEEYTKISRLYTMEKGTKTVVNAVSKGANNLTDAVNYGATNVVAPIAKIAGEVGLNITKGLFQTLVKTGAGVVNAGSKAARDTRKSLANDAELIKARAELRQSSNAIKNAYRGSRNKARKASGIEIL